MPNDTIVELPVLVDAADNYPIAIEGSREKAVQAFMSDQA